MVKLFVRPEVAMLSGKRRSPRKPAGETDVVTARDVSLVLGLKESTQTHVAGRSGSGFPRRPGLGDYGRAFLWGDGQVLAEYLRRRENGETEATLEKLDGSLNIVSADRLRRLELDLDPQADLDQLCEQALTVRKTKGTLKKR